MESKTLNIFIRCPAKKVYDFVENLANIPQWAKTFIQSIKKSKTEWIAQTPQGPVKIRMAGKNDLGVLDHYVSPAPGIEIFVPMRVVSNGEDSEVIFTLFRQTDMTEDNFMKDQALVTEDLKTLKKVLEGL